MTSSVRAADGFERVSAADVAPGEMRGAVLADGTKLCVGNADGTLFAVCDECTHSGFPLSEGFLLAGGVIECAWHGARYDARTGAALAAPAEGPLERYDVRVDEGGVWVRREGGAQ